MCGLEHMLVISAMLVTPSKPRDYKHHFETLED